MILAEQYQFNCCFAGKFNHADFWGAIFEISQKIKKKAKMLTK